MTSDPAISQQIPAYFLQEASELLQQIDTELQTMRQDFGVQKMHSLMRAAHTLKGAAASVGLDAIKTTTHSLEDAFKALCTPDATLTTAVESLIFEAYDCLQLLLSAQTSEAQIDESGILDRMANVVAKLQHHLGDQFGQDGYLPTSTELGFDMTQSIFEMGVNQRLDDLQNALKNPDAETLSSLLKSQAEVFFGLAESLNLPGFGEIAQATLTALTQRPEQVSKIATIALKDYRAAQVLILQGDRTQGGTPSAALSKLGAKHISRKTTKTSKSYTARSPKKRREISNSNWLSRVWRQLNQPIGRSKPTKPLTPKLSSLSEVVVPVDLPVNNPSVSATVQTPDSAWETAASSILPPVTVTDSKQLSTLEKQTIKPDLIRSPEQETDASPSSDLLRESTLRVSISHLEQLNHTIGELLTQQSQQALYNTRLTTAMKTLLTHLGQQQQQLHNLQRQAIQTSAPVYSAPLIPTGQLFDALELDHYSEQQLLVQASLETMVQQMESADAIELYVRQSSQTLEKQQRLVDDLRETILEARMQPLGNLLQRFRQVLTRLSMQHDKPVTLAIQGEDVLVDKAIVDKLYDPLLHLIRNAFDHGIEKPEVRQQLGKLQEAQIQLSASQASRYLVIKIQDNGQGLNLEAIRQKAVENQLITMVEAQKLTSEQVRDLIFEPELSTTAQVNELSGRGVGLDAVRSQMQRLKGIVTVASRSGKGTCFTLKIPANLTIAKLLLCQAGEKIYALMTDTIEQVLIPRPEQLNTRKNEKVLSLDLDGKAQLIPVMTLSKILMYNASLPESRWREPDDTLDKSCPIILVQYKKGLVGIEIDQLLGEQELVIHSLGDMSKLPTYIYGCSILPDGRLSLVVDGVALVLKSLAAGQQSKAAMNVTLGTSQGTSTFRTMAKSSILVIDDSITVRNTLSQTLQKAGYLVLQAKDGTEGLQKLQQADVAAILCDLEMPGMNGFEFLKARQRTPELTSIPIIMLTSRTGVKHQRLAQELGATSYLTKPYLTPQLLTTLADVLTQYSEQALCIDSLNTPILEDFELSPPGLRGKGGQS
ncbi:MAG: hybrid sensor histidine kinase/response regulator [Cyanobacteria bacterium P01_H01_bin.105]